MEKKLESSSNLMRNVVSFLGYILEVGIFQVSSKFSSVKKRCLLLFHEKERPFTNVGRIKTFSFHVRYFDISSCLADCFFHALFKGRANFNKP